MRTPVALSLALFLTTSVLAHAQDQTVTAGPWTIATSSKADKFDSCTMSRATSELDVTFVRAQDGLLLLLESPKWKLERGKAYKRSMRLALSGPLLCAASLPTRATIKQPFRRPWPECTLQQPEIGLPITKLVGR
jgi:hypothetical protein